MASLTGLIVLAGAAYYGGWEWTLLSAIALVTLWRVDFGVVPILATLGVGVFWLAMFHWTGDRRLFFPFAMQLAVQMMYLLEGRVSNPAIVGGGGIVAVFLIIRIAQSATAGVLLVEFFIAVAILALVLELRGQPIRGTGTRVLVGMLGSSLACAGLAF